MTAGFDINIEDALRTPGLRRPSDGDVPYLTPVFFRKEVLVRYFYDPRFACRFFSETYGEVDLGPSGDFPFGINPSGKVIAWLGDLQQLPEAEQMYLRSENVPSDGDISSEFYDAQIGIVYTDHVIEAELVLLKTKFAESVQEKHGFGIYGNTKPAVDKVLAACSKYKRIVFNHEDDFKRFVSEWNEVLVEDIQAGAIKEFLKKRSVPVDKRLRGIKCLHVFVEYVMPRASVSLAPLFRLYDLRVWSDHKGAANKYLGVLKGLCMPATANHADVYGKLILELRDIFRDLINGL